MIKATHFTHIVVLCLTASLGHSQSLDSEYVAPVHPVPQGKPPGMKVQLLKRGVETQEYAVIFTKGDEAFFRVARVCREMQNAKRTFHRDRRGQRSYLGLV
jgi:hypothetical protein